MKPTSDPYRVLGVLRGASTVQIKAAHRRLAKRFHPDGSTGDEQRFLAVQEAYQLLSDSQRRREWDLRHAPGPVRASSWPAAPAGGATYRRADSTARPGSRAGPRPRRAPAPRTRTWTAEHVPWWQDFRENASPEPPVTAPADAHQSGDAPHSGDAHQSGDVHQSGDDSNPDFDVFSRSSGAAWSAAARQHFRRGTDGLPSRGVWRYRGTQVVTGAEARKVAADEEKEKRPR